MKKCLWAGLRPGLPECFYSKTVHKCFSTVCESGRFSSEPSLSYNLYNLDINDPERGALAGGMRRSSKFSYIQGHHGLHGYFLCLFP